jgi:hypothetical protein
MKLRTPRPRFSTHMEQRAMMSKERHQSVVLFEAITTSFQVRQRGRRHSKGSAQGKQQCRFRDLSLSPFAHYNSPGTIFIHHTTPLAASMMRQHLGTCCYTASCLLTQTQKAGHVLSTNAPIRQSVRRTHSIAGPGSGFASSTQLSTLRQTLNAMLACLLVTKLRVLY